MLDVLKKSSLFENLKEDEITAVLGCLGSTEKKYARGRYIALEGQAPAKAGMVISGTVHILKSTVQGDEVLKDILRAGDLFGLAPVCAGADLMPMSLLAAEPSSVLFLAFKPLITTCSSACVFHTEIIKNTLKSLAQKNIFLNEKMELLSYKTIRERILAYLNNLAIQKNCRHFKIPFNREQLAEFLCVDRSALSRELGKLKKNGIIDYSKNDFRLLY